jgi:hypothetical protein
MAMGLGFSSPIGWHPSSLAAPTGANLVAHFNCSFNVFIELCTDFNGLLSLPLVYKCINFPALETNGKETTADKVSEVFCQVRLLGD